MSLVPPFVFAVAPGIILVATGLVAVWVCAARRRQSTLPARLIVGGMGLAILGAAILALLNAVAQRSLLPLIGVLALEP